MAIFEKAQPFRKSGVPVEVFEGEVWIIPAVPNRLGLEIRNIAAEFSAKVAASEATGAQLAGLAGAVLRSNYVVTQSDEQLDEILSPADCLAIFEAYKQANGLTGGGDGSGEVR